MDRAERAGVWAGWLLAPLTGTLSLLRRARMFHPEGAVYRARVETVPGPYAMLGRRLEGPALARLSTAWWRSGKEWLDALGIAIRVGRDPGAEAKRGDQDLLFATIRSPWTTPFAPLTTEQHDFLANDYYGVSPFEVAGIGRAKLRLVSSRPRRLHARKRGARLVEAVERGEASLQLEIQLEKRWEPVARIVLLEPAQVDQERLRFSPFRDGKGMAPRGFVHGLRRATYLLSQLARPLRST
ncbi:MAG TPA: hypothetical protein VFA79_13340 [Myxococcales bacterium]|nr:hypothetical protein [Myxococcales bacterium]